MKISFLGSGQMARALASSLSGSDSCQLAFYSPSGDKARACATEFKGEYLSGIGHSDIYFLCMKPQQFDSFVKEHAAHLSKEALLVSVMAGVKTKTIATALANDRVVRLMPNTPTRIGAGVAGAFGPAEDIALLKKFFNENLFIQSLKEETMMDAVTATCGSGPAIVFSLMATFIETLQDSGLSLNESRAMVARTFIGAAKMVESEKNSLEDLIAQVTSKGGTTERALVSLKETNVATNIKVALSEAMKKASELSKS
jgi:pyrroline-5-carboxylate reductase